MANALRDSETRALGFSNAPVYDRRDLGQVGRGTADSYLSAIMAAPEWLLQKMMKDDPYQRGVLQSGPQDRMKGEQRRWEEYQANQAQNRDYAQGQDYGTGLAMVADPFLDALGAIPAVGKALKLGKGAKAKPINALSDLFKGEGGALYGKVERGGFGNDFKFLKNPTKGQLKTFTDKTAKEQGFVPDQGDSILRYVVDDNTGDSFFFPAYKDTHHGFAESIGIEKLDQGFVKSESGIDALMQDQYYTDRKNRITTRNARRAERVKNL